MQVVSKQISGTIEWSEGRSRKELSKQTTWSSSKDFSGLSGLEINGFTFNHHVKCTAITSQGLSSNNILRFLLTKLKSFAII